MESVITSAIIIIIVIVVLFLIGRELLCWYYKINERIELQKETNLLQKKTNLLLETLIGNNGTKNGIDNAFFDITSIIGKSFKFENFEVAQNSFPNPMKWDDALKECNNLGDGWDLPTKDQLTQMFMNKNKLNGFSDKTYWSCTEYDKDNAWNQNFKNGNQYYDDKYFTNYVRAIRTIK